MSIKNRLDLITINLGLSGRAFEKECGLTNGSYSSIRDGIGADKLNKILSRFPQISADWLITGNGKMMKSDRKEAVPDNASPVFTGNSRFIRDTLSREESKTILFQMADIIFIHQQEISRLIVEFELNGKRADRLLDIVEHGFGREEAPVSRPNPSTVPQ